MSILHREKALVNVTLSRRQKLFMTPTYSDVQIRTSFVFALSGVGQFRYTTRELAKGMEFSQ